MFISTNELDKSRERFSSAGKQSRKGVSDFIKENFISGKEGTILTPEENLAKRKDMLRSLQQEPLDFALERAIGKNDSVYSNFVELIQNAKQKVGRIVIKSGSQIQGYATGFMVAKNLLLTNWHVFETIDDVADSEIQFTYELDTSGNAMPHVSFKLRSDVFYHSNQELDYCFVAVNPTDISASKNLKDVGYIFLDPTTGKLGNENDDEALNIIHHPEGDYKQLSIRENLFKKITPTTIWYESDTAPGSSGSPVFNDQWQVVALHHSGVAKQNNNGDYLDKNGNPIPVVNGKIDSSLVVWEANEGIRISVILKDIFSTYPNNEVINGLQATTDKPVELKKPVEQTDGFITSANNVNISFPASLVEKSGIVNININQSKETTSKLAAKSSNVSELLDLEEIKRLEETTDFSNCKGYQSGFLGTDLNIPLPQPMKEIQKFVAKIKNTNGIELKYHHYSTIFNSVRMMPVLSAINVDGDPNKRQDNSERKDKWLRDNRLSFDIQLDDEYYRGSGFDRGHMSRREDANWGGTPQEAKRNADLTCMYTNACPQVAKINQSGKKGLWGILEKVILEQGAEQENGKTAKISVFNGPIFENDDPVFRGIQVPMNFFKIILWLTDDGKLKATAFKLSQTKLVKDIDFEQIDIDANTQFKEYQCSIESLMKKTKIDFKQLVKFDTFSGEGEEVELNSVNEIIIHAKKPGGIRIAEQV